MFDFKGNIPISDDTYFSYLEIKVKNKLIKYENINKNSNNLSKPNEVIIGTFSIQLCKWINSDENENTFNGLEHFITNYLNYNLITIVDNVYAYCNKNKGIKLFGFDIDDMFMNEFDKFKQEVFTYDNISDYIIKINQIIHQEGKNKNDKVPYEVLAKLNTEKSNK